MISQGTSAIALGKSLDLEVDTGRQLLTITKDVSTQPVYLTTPHALKAGAIVATLTTS